MDQRRVWVGNLKITCNKGQCKDTKAKLMECSKGNSNVEVYSNQWMVTLGNNKDPHYISRCEKKNRLNPKLEEGNNKNQNGNKINREQKSQGKFSKT